MVISELPVDRLVVERIIGWQIEHYREVFPSFDHADWTEFYRPHILGEPGERSTVLAAFRNDQLVGAVSVVERDDLDDCDQFTPWIAAMIVDPNLRGRGIGSVLLESALEFCRRALVPRVFLWTHDMSEWYQRIGWTEEETRNFRGVRITILSREP